MFGSSTGNTAPFSRLYHKQSRVSRNTAFFLGTRSKKSKFCSEKKVLKQGFFGVIFLEQGQKNRNPVPRKKVPKPPILQGFFLGTISWNTERIGGCRSPPNAFLCSAGSYADSDLWGRLWGLLNPTFAGNRKFFIWLLRNP